MNIEKYKTQFENYCKKMNFEFNQEMFDVYCWDQEYKKERKMSPNSRNCIEILLDMVNGEYDMPLMERYQKFKSFKAMTYSLERCQLRYGNKLGKEKFDSYRNKQAYSNSFEYKQEKHGWTKDEFDEFNKSRAVTLSNMIKRHGEKLGKQKFEAYCKRQAYAGNKKEYFIEKYGEEEGLKKYHEIIEKKIEPVMKMMGHTVSNLEISVITSLLSESCQFLCRPIVNVDDYMGEYISDVSYQYEVVDRETDKHYLYDACLMDKKIFLEVNGDLWHGNTRNNYVKKLMERDSSQLCQVIKNRVESSIKKINVANKFGFVVYSIWEMDWQNHKDEIIDHFHKWVESDPQSNYSTEETYGNESC